MITSSLTSYDSSGKSGKRDLLGILHRITCIWCGLVALYWLFMCVLSFLNVQEDIAKFEPLGVYRPIHYYLREYYSLEMLCLFLWVTIEYILYIILCRCVEMSGYTRRSILYFSIMLMVHVTAWLYFNTLPIPKYPPYSEAEAYLAFCRKVINETTMPTVVYFVLYLWRVRRLKSEVLPKSGDCA